MIEMLKDTLFTWPDDGLEWFALIMIWIITLLIVGFLIAGALYLVDSTFLADRQGSGTISAMVFKPSHYTTTMIYNAATKTSTPHTVYHPDAWYITITVDGLNDDFYVSERDYMKLRFGQSIDVTYSKGRIFDSLYIKSASM